MSTNYFVLETPGADDARPSDGEHVGKRSAGRFLFAIEPAAVEALIEAHPEEQVFIDECGTLMTGVELAEVLAVLTPVTANVGTWFR